MSWHIDVLTATRKVAAAVFQPIIVKSFSVSIKEEESLMRYASLLEGDIVETVNAGHEFCQGAFSPEGLRNFDGAQHKDDEFLVRFVEDDGSFFNILGNEVKPPPVDVRIEKCAVNRFSYIERDSFGKDGFVVYAVDNTKCIVSLRKDRQWVLDSID